MIRNKFLFYLLSFTWGLPMTLVGCIAAAALLMTGHKPQKWGYCWCFEVGKSWGGVNLGPIIITSKNPSDYTKAHEHGHSLQNCQFGPFMIVISVLSMTRYWYRRIRVIIGKPDTTGYYSVWYEAQASTLGMEFIDWYNTKQND